MNTPVSEDGICPRPGFDQRSLVVLRRLAERAGYSDTTARSDRFEYGDLEVRFRYDVSPQGVSERRFSRGEVSFTGTTFDDPEDAARWVALQLAFEIRTQAGLPRIDDARRSLAFARAARVELDAIRWCALQPDPVQALDLAAGDVGTAEDDVPHAVALGRLVGNRPDAPATLDGIRRAHGTLFEYGDHENASRIVQRGDSFDVLCRHRASEHLIASTSHVEDAERLVVVLERSSGIRIPGPHQLSAVPLPRGVLDRSRGLATELEWQSDVDGASHSVRSVARAPGRSSDFSSLVRLTWLRDVPVNVLADTLRGRDGAFAVGGPVGVTLGTTALIRAFSRGRGGFRDDAQSAVVCSEFRRLVRQGDLPEACWEPVREAVHGTHMDSWSSGLRVDDRYEALWPLFEGPAPRLSDETVAAVDVEVALAAVEYGLTVVPAGPRVARRFPVENDTVTEVWNGAGWSVRPGAEFGHPMTRSEAVRFAGVHSWSDLD